MNNLIYTRGTDEAIYKAGRKGLHAESRVYLESLKDELVEAYANYHQLMAAGNLHQLSELWKVDYLAPAAEREVVEKKRRFVHDLYKSNRPIVTNHKEDILEQNHCDSIICPICGIESYEEWDHYVPRELMPEYSVLTSNLIPLCHDCNHAKNTLWLNDDESRRLIFNAFMDVVPNVPIVSCTLEIDGVLGMPRITVTRNPALRTEVPEESIIITTIEKLHLIDKYQEEANKSVNKTIQALLDRLNVRRSDGELDMDALLKEEKNVWREHIVSCNTWNFLERMIFEELSKEEALVEWFRRQ